MKHMLYLLVFCAMASANDPVILKYKGADGSVELHRADIERIKENSPIPEIRQAPTDKVFRLIRDQELMARILHDAARKKQLEKDEKVKEMMKEAMRMAILKRYIEIELEKRVTNQSLLDLYDELSKKFKPQPEYEIDVIVTRSEDEAKTALKELEGKSWDDVCKRRSVHEESKKKGGHLGYIIEKAVTEIFGDDARKQLSSLKKGRYSKRPVKTRDGNIVIMRKGNERPAQKPKFDEVVSQLREAQNRREFIKIMDALRKEANYSTADWDGNPEEPQSLDSAMPPIA